MFSQGKTVLVVDDDATVAAGTAMRLKASGYETRLAADGELALESLSEQVPDLIIMDVRMPRLDGISALRQIRANEHTSEIPVVILSASMQDEEVALDAGASFFIKKPYRGADLLEAAECAMGALSTC